MGGARKCPGMVALFPAPFVAPVPFGAHRRYPLASRPSSPCSARAHLVCTVVPLALLAQRSVRALPALESVVSIIQASCAQCRTLVRRLPLALVPSHGASSAGARAAPHCKERTSCPHTSGGASSQTSPTPVPTNSPLFRSLGKPLVEPCPHASQSGRRERLVRDTAAPQDEPVTCEDLSVRGKIKHSGSIHEGRAWEVEGEVLDSTGIRTSSRIRETQRRTVTFTMDRCSAHYCGWTAA